MKYDKRSEYGVPPKEYSFPPEHNPPACEHSAPEEQYSQAEEYPAPETVTKAREESGSKMRTRLKKLLFMPVAAAVASVSIVYASYNYDALRELDEYVYGGHWGDYDYSYALEDVEYTDPEDGVVEYHYHIIYVPTAESYSSPLPDEEGRADMERWAESKGADLSTLHLYDTTLAYTGIYKSDDAIIVGDPVDDYEHIYVAQGEVYKTYRREMYYEVFGVGKPGGTEEEDEFPKLQNLEPDFAGDYAWADDGSEEYIIVDNNYLCAGTYYTEKGVEPGNISGASYDKAANTLTLNNYSGVFIDTNLMGNGFRIELIGENELEYLQVWGAMYGGSVTFTGSGKLTLNSAQDRNCGLILMAEDSESCIMVDSGVTVEVYGAAAAIVVSASKLDEAIYYRKDIKLTGGKGGKATIDGETVYTVVDADGSPAKHVIFEKND